MQKLSSIQQQTNQYPENFEAIFSACISHSDKDQQKMFDDASRKYCRNTVNQYTVTRYLETNYPSKISSYSYYSASKTNKLGLVVGQSGAGKSTFINHFLHSNRVVVPEGDDVLSCTKEPEVYEMTGTEYNFIDTPGFDDTKMTQKEIKNLIKDKLSKVLHKCNTIDAVIMIWNPAFLAKFSFPKMKEDLTNLFGPNIFDSLVVLLNVPSESMENPKVKLRLDQAVELLKKENLGRYIKYDLKDNNSSDTKKNALELLFKDSKPYLAEDFKLWKKQAFYQRYLKIKAEEDALAKQIEEKKKLIEKAKEEEHKRELENQRKNFFILSNKEVTTNKKYL